MRLIVSGAYAFAIALVLSPLWVSDVRADDGEDSVFCAWAQQLIAGTELVANVATHTGYEDFVKSKADTSPLTVQQYWSNPLNGPGGMPQVVSCKMKTAERINNAQAEAGQESVVAAGDTSCELVHREVLGSLLSRIPRGQLAVPADKLRVDEEDTTFIGPMWLKPWPFEPLYRDEAGLVHIRSRALYVPFAWWIPMPDRFKGTYYCHLIAPDFLEALLRGEVSPGL